MFNCIYVTCLNNLFCKNLRKWWYLISMSFVYGTVCHNTTKNSTTVIFEYYTKDFWIWNMNLENKWYFLYHRGITSRIAWINLIYFASFVLKVISICNLLHHNTGNNAYIITYPVRNMRFYALSASAWSHPPAKSISA